MNGRRDYLGRLVSQLFDLTNRGKLTWETTSDENRFVVVLEKGTVEIEESDAWFNPATGESEYFYTANVLDEAGRSLDTIVQKDIQGGSGGTHSLVDLYRAAKSCALNSDGSVQQLLTELEALGQT